jgi:cobalamin biosynthesis protein CobT
MAYIIQSALFVLNNSFHTLIVEHETQKLLSSKHEQDLNSLRLVVQALQTENIQLKDSIPFLMNENKALKDTNTDLTNSLRDLSEKLVELSSANAVELEDETHVHHQEQQEEQVEQVEQQVEEQEQQVQVEEQEQEQEQVEEQEQEQEQEDTEHVEEEEEIYEEEQEPSHVEEQEHVQQLSTDSSILYETQYSLTRNYREQITRVTSGAIVSQIRSVSWQMGRYRPAAIVPQKIIQTLLRSNSGPCSISRLSRLVLISKNELKKYIRELKKQGIVTDM